MKKRNVGLIMTLVALIESLVLYGLWPYYGVKSGMSPLNWAMVAFMIVGVVQCYIYIYWYESSAKIPAVHDKGHARSSAS